MDILREPINLTKNSRSKQRSISHRRSQPALQRKDPFDGGCDAVTQRGALFCRPEYGLKRLLYKRSCLREVDHVISRFHGFKKSFCSQTHARNGALCQVVRHDDAVIAEFPPQ